ncbi:MAG: hypothetical protein ACOVOI_17070, partial [Hyphomicrobiales bacterium]
MTSFGPILSDIIAPVAPARAQARGFDASERFSDFLSDATAGGEAAPPVNDPPTPAARSPRVDDSTRASDGTAQDEDVAAREPGTEPEDEAAAAATTAPVDVSQTTPPVDPAGTA